MLPLEVIGVLGFLYCFFMHGTLKAIQAKKAVRPKAKAKAQPVAMDKVLGTAKQTP